MTLDIFEMPQDARVVVSVKELRDLYIIGRIDGSEDDFDNKPTIECETL